jgi:hypothetical protein
MAGAGSGLRGAVFLAGAAPGEVGVVDGLRVAGAGLDRASEQIDEAADVAVGGMSFVEDAVFADRGAGQSFAGDEPDPASADRHVGSASGAAVQEEVVVEEVDAPASLVGVLLAPALGGGVGAGAPVELDGEDWVRWGRRRDAAARGEVALRGKKQQSLVLDGTPRRLVGIDRVGLGLDTAAVGEHVGQKPLLPMAVGADDVELVPAGADPGGLPAAEPADTLEARDHGLAAGAAVADGLVLGAPGVAAAASPDVQRHRRPARTVRGRRRRSRLVDADRGGASIQILYIAIIGLLFAAGLHGGGTVLAARSHGYGLAQSAARAGAQQIDVAAYRATGELRLDPTLAAQAAVRFLAEAGATGVVDHITATEITVTATSRQPTPALRTFGYPAVIVTATATAAITPQA